MPKNLVEPERTQTIWRLSAAYWISKPTRAQVHARAHAPTHTDARTKTHNPTRARAHTLTHRNMSYLLLSTTTVVSRTRLHVTRTLSLLFTSKFILNSVHSDQDLESNTRDECKNSCWSSLNMKAQRWGRCITLLFL